MEEKNITMADLITKVIKENQLAPAEEDAVLAMLGERKQERDEKRICRCLAEYEQKELDLMLAVRNRLDCEKCRRVTKLCFKESRIGSMDIEDFSKADIRKLIILTAENRRLDNEDRLAFLFTLQGALNQMDREGVLGFRPPENIADAYMAAMDRITYIDRPYTLEEVQKITEWIDRNRQDMAALAAGLWLEADITAEEVTELKKEDLMDADGACIKNPSVLKKNAAEDYIAVAGRRARIIQNALALHGEENLEYIFMDKGREGWKKMSRKRLPQKMSWICREIGIAYQPVKCTDAIKPCEG